ncbi:hypothetical protein P168DRAFT_97757 [Aspergillus campestris IBT 28561]|uniref:Transmembrane protein n=1 Tax=Aspergillus campestris (strain IBT 28561) TaxID=1392248 RepID=A0A2I1DCF1_ASPC2|nr:uncharacterized protein P168DRAFT_97757 [Aspergillus campestris IBT 28561]PKY07545.1 hypothetical protein P168DRAFT_97757 [Aspergillus campestris IBT 28561]
MHIILIHTVHYSPICLSCLILFCFVSSIWGVWARMVFARFDGLVLYIDSLVLFLFFSFCWGERECEEWGGGGGGSSRQVGR